MPTELERSRERLADAVLRIVTTSGGTDDPSLTRVASEALEEIIGYPSAFEPVDLPLGFTVSFEQLTRNDVAAVVSHYGVEVGRETVDRPCGGMGVFGDARFQANVARHYRWWTDCLRIAGKQASVIRDAEQIAEEAESALQDLVIGNPRAFSGRSLAAQRVRAWSARPERGVKRLIEALATEPLPYLPTAVWR